MEIKINLDGENILEEIKKRTVAYVVQNSVNMTEASKILGISIKTLYNYDNKGYKINDYDYKTEKKDMKRLFNYIKEFICGSKSKKVRGFLKRNTDDVTFLAIEDQRTKMRSEILDENEAVRSKLSDISMIMNKIQTRSELTEIEIIYCKILFDNKLIDGSGQFTEKGKNELLH